MDQEQILFHRDRDEETPLQHKGIKTYIIALKENRSENSAKTFKNCFQKLERFFTCKKEGHVYVPSNFSTKTLEF